MPVERTYIMIKPDGVRRNLVGEIIRRFENRELRLVGLQLHVPTREIVDSHYHVHRNAPFFADLVRSMTSGPVVATTMKRILAATAVTLMTFLVPFNGSARASGSHGYTPQSFLHWGQWHLARHHWDEARYYFLLTLQSQPNNADAHAGLGTIYLSQGNRERAREEFQFALRSNPHLAAAEFGIHEARTPGEEEQAFVQLQAQVLQEPDNADLHATMAEELLERSQTDKARAEAATALRLNAHEGHAMVVLGRIAMQAGDDEGARRLLQSAIHEGKKDDDAHAALGDLAMKTKDWPTAISSYRRAVDIVPEHAEWHRKLADALAASGNASEAVKERQKADQLTALTAGGS